MRVKEELPGSAVDSSACAENRRAGKDGSRIGSWMTSSTGNARYVRLPSLDEIDRGPRRQRDLRPGQELPF